MAWQKTVSIEKIERLKWEHFADSFERSKGSTHRKYIHRSDIKMDLRRTKQHPAALLGFSNSFALPVGPIIQMYSINRMFLWNVQGLFKNWSRFSRLYGLLLVRRSDIWVFLLKRRAFRCYSAQFLPVGNSAPGSLNVGQYNMELFINYTEDMTI